VQSKLNELLILR